MPEDSNLLPHNGIHPPDPSDDPGSRDAAERLLLVAKSLGFIVGRRCARCGTPIYGRRSLALGYGPVCWSRMQAERAAVDR